MHFSKLSVLGLVVATSILAGCGSTTTVHEGGPGAASGSEPGASSGAGASGSNGPAPGPARRLSFAKPTPYTTTRRVLVMQTLDFDGDGHPDIAVAGGAGDVGLMRNAGDGTFEDIVWRKETLSGEFDTVLAVGDLNRDGLGDLVFTTLTRDSSDGGIYFILGATDGTVAEPTKLRPSYTSYPTGPLLVADMNVDGIPDVIHCETHTVSVTTLTSSTTSGTIASTSPDAQRHCAVGDFNGDGRMDLVTAESGQTIGVSLTSESGARPKLTTLYPSKNESLLQTGLYAADVNGDGRSDAIGLFGGNMLVYLANEDGTLAEPIVSEGELSVRFRDAGTYAKLADMNGDGKLDAVLVHGGASGDKNIVAIMLGDGAGKFAQAEVDLGLLGGGPASDIAVADFDGDGLPDLAVAYGERNYVLHNTSR